MPAVLDIAKLPVEQLAPAERLALASPAERERILGGMVDEALQSLRWDWHGFWARPEQRAPAHAWSLWAYIAGRGTGKTRTGSEETRQAPNRHRRIALVAATAADARDVMIEGPSGILAVSPKGERPKYEPSKRRVTWPNGAEGIVYSDAEPEALRGFEGSYAWVDELGKYRHPEDTMANLAFALRSVAAKTNPQRVITTTPRVTPTIRKLLAGIAKENERQKSKNRRPRQYLSTGSTYRNLANLAAEFVEEIFDMFEGTRLGEQELHGILLEEVEGALWNYALLERQRWRGLLLYDDDGHEVPAGVRFARKVVSVDPPGKDTGAECGIIVAGSDSARPKQNAYVLDDRSRRGTPGEWSRAAVMAAADWRCGTILVENNYGGQMAAHTIRTVEAWTERGRSYPAGDTFRIVEVPAKGSKSERAEPVLGKYEQRRVWHVGRFPELEDQQRTWVPDEPGGVSPDRMDALVHAVSHLLVLNPRRSVRSSGAQTARARLDVGTPNG